MRPTRGFLLGLCGIILLHLTLVLTSAEEYIPDAGVGTVHPICDSGSEGVICRSEEEELVASLERDEHIAGETYAMHRTLHPAVENLPTTFHVRSVSHRVAWQC